MYITIIHSIIKCLLICIISRRAMLPHLIKIQQVFSQFRGGFEECEDNFGFQPLYSERRPPKKVEQPRSVDVQSKINQDKENYYLTLNVLKTATTEQVKKAYQELVKQFNIYDDPTEQFKDILRAYQTLSDPVKRKIYDAQGEQGFIPKQTQAYQQNLYEEVHSNMQNHIRKTVTCTLEDVYKGTVKTIKISRTRLCNECNGTGEKLNASKHLCSNCEGRGFTLSSFGFLVRDTTETKCLNCHGKGYFLSSSDICPRCKGRSIYDANTDISILLERGVKNKKTYRLKREGNQSEDSKEIGDLLLEINICNHNRFTRAGYDLYMTEEISLYQALSGYKKQIEYLDGTKFIIEGGNKIIGPDTKLTIIGKGLPIYRQPKKYGNLFITFKIVFPDKLTQGQIVRITNGATFNKPPNATIVSLVEKKPIHENNSECGNNHYYDG